MSKILNLQIINKFIQNEIKTGKASDEYIEALAECTSLEELIEVVKYWKNLRATSGYLSEAHYILLSLDNE